VDEYLSEKEQLERIREWWRDNGWYLIGGAVLGGLGLFGYGQYQEYTTNRALGAADLYQSVRVAIEDDDLATVDGLLAQLRNDYAGTPYADQAGLLVARMLLIRDSERAARELRLVMDSTDDDNLATIVRLRLARVLAYREEYDEALAVLNVEEVGDFEARIRDIQGDIYLAQGNVDAARAAFAEALVAPGSNFVDRTYVQMKLGELIGGPVSGTIDAGEEQVEEGNEG
jgi:predicted negative regulator of RcsB-dependent stress response